MFIEVGASCRNSSSFVSYLYESFSGLKTFVGKKDLIFVLSLTCVYVVSVRMSCPFSLLLEMGCVIIFRLSWATHIKVIEKQ